MVLTLKLKGSERHRSPTMESPFDRPSALRTARMAAVTLPVPSPRMISQLLLESDPSRLPVPIIATYAFLWHPWTSSLRLYPRILNYNMPPHIQGVEVAFSNASCPRDMISIERRHYSAAEDAMEWEAQGRDERGACC